jgi:diguanylate cyclase (GGDEF)-like protein/PAS domain S-box-containing protein
MPDKKIDEAPATARKPKSTKGNRKRVNELLPGDGHLLDSVLDVVFDGAYFVDTQRRILKWNAGASSLTGFSDRDVLGHYCYDNILMHVDGCGAELCKCECPLQKTLDDGQSRQAAVYLRHKHGYRVPVSVRIVPIAGPNGKVVGALETFRVTDEPDYWKARTAELEGMAFIDQLTSIPNRRFLETQLDRLLHEFQYIHEPFILGMLDLDHFRHANDKHGHQIGDCVLRLVGQTLLNCVRGTDIVGRWGGDEFVVLLPRTNLTKARQILERARLMVADSATPIEGGTLKTSVSIGAVIVTREDDRVSLLQKADRQLYLAKQQGRNYCCVE